MKSPLLSQDERDAGGGQRGCFMRALSWAWDVIRRRNRERTECAETVMRLMQLMNMLEMASKNAFDRAEKKRNDIARLMTSKTADRSLARIMLQTAKRYDAQGVQCATMREVAETFKIELQSHQQTLSTYDAFAQTNAAMERIASRVNVNSAEALMSAIQSQIEEGKSVSEIFASARTSVEEQYDQDELDAELDALSIVRSTAVVASFPAAPVATMEKEKEEGEPAKKGVAKKNAVLG